MNAVHLSIISVVSLLLAGCAALTPASDEGDIDVEPGVRLHYRVEGTGAALIVLHGGPGLHYETLASDLTPLAAHHRLIYYDQRGAGRSTPASEISEISLTKHIADLDAVRRHFGLDRTALLGHSWGAGLAMHYARIHPERVSRVVMLDAIPPRSTPYGAQMGENLRAWMDDKTANELTALAAARKGAADPRAACQAYWRVFIRGYMAEPHNDTVLARMRGDVCSAPATGIVNSAAAGARTRESLGAWDWRRDFSALTLPVLLLHGERDPIPVAAAREWRDALPGAELVIIEGAGHFPHVEKPESVFPRIVGFLH